ncbi:galectin-1-like isoform X2 [Hyperolius riggenbachi]|uniref:galectin-1-like isoform X2 n=1 Tax=Hyperolius riggenbachi TaxID=752182 RepID=UPI0035A2A02A
MAFKGVSATNLRLKLNQGLRVKGYIPKDSPGFAINVGKDSNNFALHFNPRFDQNGDTKKTILNSLQGGVWGAEEKKDVFPFKQGAETTVFFKFQGNSITVKLPSGEELSFPLPSPVDEISSVFLVGLHLKNITIE